MFYKCVCEPVACVDGRGPNPRPPHADRMRSEKCVASFLWNPRSPAHIFWGCASTRVTDPGVSGLIIFTDPSLSPAGPLTARVRNRETDASETQNWDFRETENTIRVQKVWVKRREQMRREEGGMNERARERPMWLRRGGRLGQVDECLGFKNRCHPELARAGHNDLQSPKPNRQPSRSKLSHTHTSHQSTNTVCLSKDSLSQHPGLITHTNSLILPLLFLYIKHTHISHIASWYSSAASTNTEVCDCLNLLQAIWCLTFGH